jgi:galactarate dehydratase
VKSIPVDSASIVSLQDEKHVGFKSMVDDILQVAERHLEKLNQRQRETCPASELVVGMQCGGSDAFSGVTANPAVGYASDLLVRCGATVMFSEVTEVRDAIHLLTPRAINEEVGKRLLEEMAWYDNYLDMGKTDRSANPPRATRKAAWRTWWKKRWARLPNPGRARLPKCSLRAAPDQTRPDLRRDAGQRFCLRHSAGGFRHHGAGLYHRSRYAVRPDGGAGDKWRPVPSWQTAGMT